MSTDFAVKVVRINGVVHHPNADKLDLCTIAGWQCVVQKGSFSLGDLAVYIPIDSVLPDRIECILFGPESKIKLNKSRVRTIKIRGAISQGMLARCSLLNVPEKEGYDCTKELGIVKFEPPEAPPSMRGNPVSKKKKNAHFKEYGGIDNFKHHPDLFKDGEAVVITEKIHGSNARFGWVPSNTDTLMKRIKRLLGILPKYEFVFGSNRVQLQNRVSSSNKILTKLLSWIPIKVVRTLAYNGYYAKTGVGNVYEEVVDKYRLRDITDKPEFMGLVFYGEVYGDGVQKNYHYGCKNGERKFVGFDIMTTSCGEEGESKFLDHDVAEVIFRSLNLDVVPVLHKGPYNSAYAKSLTIGNSVLCPSQKVIEGIVIRPVHEEKSHIGRKLLKLISDEYLLRDDNTDFH